MIPKLPDPRELADAVKEDAGREHLEPAAVEKDFHLTRLIWALGEKLEQKLLLKGGTCLSKVDLGYHRMSEDADFVLPWSSSLKNKGTNARATNLVRDALMELAPKLEMNSTARWRALRPEVSRTLDAPLPRELSAELARG